MNLVAIPGSLREASHNKQLLRLAVKLLEAGGAKVDWIDLRALAIPIYDGDLEASSGLPAGALELAARVAAADGIVIASPENNFSIPAVVKNWIDWLSRAKPMPLRGKSALLLSASPSLVGGSRGLISLRIPLEVLGVHVYPDMFSLATAHQAFKPDGEIGDEALAKFLRRVVDGYLRVGGAIAAAEQEAMSPRAPLTPQQVGEFHKTLSNWGRFGRARPARHVEPDHAREARAPRRRWCAAGRTVSCARPLPTQPSLENPNPVVHHMIGTATEGYGGDYFAIAPHGFVTSHIDALCHIFHEGKLYNGYPIERVTAHGALELGIHELRDGVVSRGVLLDVPRARGVRVPRGRRADLSGRPRARGARRRACASRRATSCSCTPAAGRCARRAVRGIRASCWRGSTRRACPGCTRAASRRSAATACRTWCRRAIEGIDLPIHTVAIVAMGLHLLDNLELAPLAEGVRRGAPLGVPAHARAAGAVPRHGVARESDRAVLDGVRRAPGARRTRGGVGRAS